MASNKHEFKIATFEDGTCAVLRTDPNKPRLLEAIATFYDAAHARDYVRLQNAPSDEHREERRPIIKQAVKGKPKQALGAKPEQASKAEPKQLRAAKPVQTSKVQPKEASAAKPKLASEAKPKNVVADVSERQTAVLKALRSLMDKKHRVEVRGAELAKAASIPFGSLHSVLVSLEKKGMIRTERQGSALFRAIYEVLDAPQKSALSANDAAHGKEAPAAARTH
jgi:hypothetical protein